MAVRLTCPECEKSFTVSGGSEGDPIECPRCGATMVVPATEDAPRARKRSARDDDRPRRKGNKNKKAGNSNWKVYAGVGGGAAVLIAVVLALTLGKGKKGGGGAGDADLVGPVAGEPGATGGGTQAPPPDGIVRIRVDESMVGLVRRVVHGGASDDGYLGAVIYTNKVLTKDEFDKLGNGQPPFTRRIDIYRVRTGQKVASPTFSEELGPIATIGPDAKYIATSSARVLDTLRLISTADGSEVGRLVPNPGPGGPPDRLNQLHWCAFLSADRLLTATTGGGYDVWSVPGLQRLGGRPSAKFGARVAAAGDRDDVPDVVSLSPDRKAIAVFNGTGVSVVDLASGTEKVRTEDFMPKEEYAHGIVRITMAPDQKRVCALTYAQVGDRSRCRLLEFDAAGGKQLSESQFPAWGLSDTGSPGLYWWGPNHLVLGHSGTERLVFHVPTRVVNSVGVEGPPFGSLQLTSGTDVGGRLWYLGQDSVTSPVYLFGLLPAALPARPNDQKKWVIPVKLGKAG